MGIKNESILNHEFESFDINLSNEKVRKFELKELTGSVVNNQRKPSQEIIRTERKNARATSFQIDNTVYEHRGLRQQELDDFEKTVEAEVQRRLNQKVDQAVKEGFEEGIKLGTEKSYQESKQIHESQIESLTQILNELKENRKNIFLQNQNECYEMVRALTKWMLLKEIDGADYLKRLLEKVIYEIGEKSHLLVRVNKSSFAQMPEVIKSVEEKIGQLPNIRVEIEHDMHNPGLIVESGSKLINASVSSQFNAIDEVFKSVGILPQENSLDEINKIDPKEESNSGDDEDENGA